MSSSPQSALSAPEPRQSLHNRRIECHGYEREDGLYDIEGHMTDVKSYSFRNRQRGQISAGQPIHDMWLRLTVDEDLHIHGAEAATAASPFGVCPQITERYQLLVGVTIGPGWRRKIKQLFAGVRGCTHLTELLGPMATTAYQTVVARRRAREQSDNQKSAQSRPGILNTCHAFDTGGQVVMQFWPEHYTGDGDREVEADTN